MNTTNENCKPVGTLADLERLADGRRAAIVYADEPNWTLVERHHPHLASRVFAAAWVFYDAADKPVGILFYNGTLYLPSKPASKPLAAGL